MKLLSGLIFDPIKNEMFFAEKNNGAFYNNQRIRVSKKNQMNNCLFATGGNIEKELNLPFRKSGCSCFRYGLCSSWKIRWIFSK